MFRQTHKENLTCLAEVQHWQIERSGEDLSVDWSLMSGWVAGVQVCMGWQQEAGDWRAMPRHTPKKTAETQGRGRGTARPLHRSHYSET